MFGEIIGNISGFMYGKLLVIMLIAVGLYFTFRTKFVQFRLFGESIRVVTEKPMDGGVSSFQALMVSTASRVGTGNIVGVSTAICLGGYGAVFWMWIIAILGGASAFIESTLAQIYKRRDHEGHCYGGPAYYIEAAIKSPVLGAIFAISMLLTYAGGFNMLASYNLQSTFSVYSFYNEKTTPIVIGAILAVIVGYCLLGGGKRILNVTSKLVPLMGLLYVAVSLIIVFTHLNLFPGMIGQIFSDAFDFSSIFGGFTGSCMMYGIKRGLFSNEAGVGSAPNAAASAEVHHPVKQGLVQMLSVFIDTLLLCTCTAFMCLCSGVAPAEDLAGAPYVQAAMQNALGAIGPVFVTVAMVLFAFTTLLGNFYYVDNLLIYLNGKKEPSATFMFCFRILASVIIFVGALLSMGVVWDLADVLMGIMAIINLPVICIAGGTALKALDDYSKQKKEGKSPVFKASTVGLEGKVDYWQD